MQVQLPFSFFSAVWPNQRPCSGKMNLGSDGRCNLLRHAVLQARSHWAQKHGKDSSIWEQSYVHRIGTDCSGLDTPALAASLLQLRFHQPPFSFNV